MCRHGNRKGFVGCGSSIERLDEEPGNDLISFVAQVIAVEEVGIIGVKNVTVNEPFFEGHFPGQPVMPGVLILEAMAQTGGILLLNGVENPGDVLVFFLSINNAKFRKPVVPGDQLVMELTMMTRKSKICQMQGKAYVDGALVAEAEMMASIIDRKDPSTSGAGKRS